MLAVRTILHPTDFSERSGYALRLACALARDHGADLILLHVASIPVIGYAEGVMPPDPEEHLGEVREMLYRIEVPDTTLRVKRQLLQGDPVSEILRVAQDSHADLIVM